MSTSTLSAPPTERPWAFLTNHAQVLLVVAADPSCRVRDIATQVGITERAVQGILSDLQQTGYLTRDRVGRRNRYTVHRERPIGHALSRDQSLEPLLSVLVPS